MKTGIRFLPAILAFAAVGCTQRPVHPDFGEAIYGSLLKHDSTACRVEYHFASIRNSDAAEALRTIERANIGYFFELEEFSGTPAEAADSAMREIAANVLSDLPATGEFEVSVESRGAVVDSLLTYVIVRSSYLGGAHGSYETEYHNYSLRDGYELCTADLFTTEQLQALDERIRTKLYERYGATDDPGLSVAGLFPDYIAATENFLVTPDGITFLYNPYEIGCYALGTIEVKFTKAELEALRR